MFEFSWIQKFSKLWAGLQLKHIFCSFMNMVHHGKLLKYSQVGKTLYTYFIWIWLSILTSILCVEVHHGSQIHEHYKQSASNQSKQVIDYVPKIHLSNYPGSVLDHRTAGGFKLWHYIIDWLVYVPMSTFHLYYFLYLGSCIF